MKIDIICPLYNAENYIVNLHNSILMQKKVNINSIRYVLTESKDNSEELLKKLNECQYHVIKKEEFSHSLVREKEALECDGDIICFITQDVVIKDVNWLYELTKDIDDEIVACYSRQKTKYDNIEKYTRERNYPENEFVVSKDDIKEKGLRTFFFSDAAGAINLKVFKKLNGYDGKNLPISEDMYFAYKIIMNGYKIKYCANSVVYHSHKFKLKEIYDRYKLTGKFMKENDYLDKYGTTGSGADLAKYILKRAWQDKNIKVLVRWLPDMAARYLGMKAGKR